MRWDWSRQGRNRIPIIEDLANSQQTKLDKALPEVLKIGVSTGIFLGKYMRWTRWRQRYIQEEGMRRLPRWVYIICIYSSWKGYKLINLSSAEFISGEGVFAGVVRISCLWVVVWSQIGSKWPTIVLCWIDIFCQEHVNTEGHWY